MVDSPRIVSLPPNYSESDRARILDLQRQIKAHQDAMIRAVTPLAIEIGEIEARYPKHYLVSRETFEALPVGKPYHILPAGWMK
jgi:hypothetical protein